MDYEKLYNNLILKAIARNSVEGYFEKHHILPKSLGGSNDASNLVALTAREHFIAHYLLAKIHGGSQWVALLRMKGSKNRYVNSHLYEVAKKEWASKISGENNSFYGKKHNSESLAKNREKNSGEKNAMHGLKGEKSPFYGRKHTSEWIKNMSNRMSGEKNPMHGRKRSAESLAKGVATQARNKFIKQCMKTHCLNWFSF